MVQVKSQVKSLKRKLESDHTLSQSHLLQKERQIETFQSQLNAMQLRLEKVEKDRALLFERVQDVEKKYKDEQHAFSEYKVPSFLLYIKENKYLNLLANNGIKDITAIKRQTRSI